MDMMTKQLSQITTSLNAMRGNDEKISATVKIPEIENISKITRRSGRAYEEPKIAEPEVASEERKEKEEEEVPPENLNKGVPQTKPFRYRGGAKKKREDLVDFMEIFGKLEINLPFLQALKLPPFSRFIKEFIAGKTQSDGKIVIGENVSAVIQKKKLPSKRTDPGVFTLPITIGGVKVEHAMCDLGASINVLPYSVYTKLMGARLIQTKVVIQLADRSCINPMGVLENVIVKVHDFLYPADFHVLRMSEDVSAESSGVLL
ncbi:hypothetical protein AAHA92_24670 [Salvia divinorum]|uniref:Aspartic peptidase DDI1-type domain-containing protein n=1 Tax=Salvia divinorum TaxID=28513 RepID=A0ABD1G873_SALDI